MKTRVLDSWAILEWMSGRQIAAGDIWNAASLKGRFPIAYADGFAAALAQKYNCPLVTGDPEFRSVDQLELDWIGDRKPPPPGM